MQGFPCTLWVVWKLLLSSQNLSCLALSCRKPKDARQQGWTQHPLGQPARQQAKVRQRGARASSSQSSSLVGERIQRPPEQRTNTLSGIPLIRTASPSHLGVICIWLEKDPFLNLKFAKCWSASMSGIISCTNWNINFYNSSLKVELTSTNLKSVD